MTDDLEHRRDEWRDRMSIRGTQNSRPPCWRRTGPVPAMSLADVDRAGTTVAHSPMHVARCSSPTTCTLAMERQRDRADAPRYDCPGLSVVPRPALSRASAFPEGGALVREEDATALVADVMMSRAARGLDVTVPPERIVWLYRGAVVMLGAFGPGPATEDSDD